MYGSSLVRSSAATVGAAALSILVGFLVPSLVARTLGPEQYGAWAVAIACAAQIMLLDCGLRNTMVRLLAPALARGEIETAQLVRLKGHRLLSLAGVASAIVLLVLASVPQAISPLAPPELARLIGYALSVLALGAVLDHLSGSYDATLAAAERYDILSMASSMRLVIQATLMVLFVSSGHGIVGCATAVVIARAAYTLVVRQASRRVYGADAQSLSPEIAPPFRDLALSNFALLLGNRLIYGTDIVLAGLFLSPAIVALYVAPAIIIEQLRGLMQSTSTILQPRLSALHAQGDHGTLREITLRWTTASSLLACWIGIPLLVSGPSFIRLWMGESFAAGGVILQLLTIPFFVVLPSAACAQLLVSSGGHRYAAVSTLVEAALNLALSIALVQIIGLPGIAIGTLVPALIVRGAIVPVIVRKSGLISRGDYLRAAFGRPLGAALPYIMVLGALEHSISSGTWATLLLQNVAGTVVFVGCVWLVVFDATEREYLGRQLRA